MKNFRLNFGGFYESIHDELIESMLESYFMDDSGDIIDYSDYDIDYNLIRIEYIKRYIDSFEEFIRDDFKIDIKIHNHGLISPQFYNYSTEYIDAAISEATGEKIMKMFKKDSKFTVYLTNAVKSYDGFISFYDFHDAYNDKDGILLSYIFDYIVMQFDEVFMNYYDINNIYETLYSIDFIKSEAA